MTRRTRIDRLADIVLPEQPALSPDATQVAYVVRTSNRTTDHAERNLWWVPTAGGPARRLTRGGTDSAPAWAPDGTSIAFLRAADGPAQVWRLPVAGGEAEQVTTLPLGAGAPVWSPDGTRLAFAAPVDLAGGDASAGAAAPIATDGLGHQVDGAGYLGTMRMHVHVVELATGRCRQVTDGDWHAGDPQWSPDGRRLAFAAAREPDADLTGRAAVHVVSAVDEIAEPELVGLPDGLAATATWSADGSALVVTGYPGEPVGHLQLLRVTLDGGATDQLAAELDRNVMPGGPGYPGGLPQLGKDGTVVFCARDRGCTHVFAVPLDGGEARPLVAGAERNVSGLSVVGDQVAVVLGTGTSFGEIVVLDVATGAETVLTDHGSATADLELFAAESREFMIDDGTIVHGWQLRDPAVTGPGPLLLDIHGGPHNSWSGTVDGTHLYHHELVSRGWTVLLLNPRGSDGYGEAFHTGLHSAWGSADAADFLRPVEQLVAEGIADPQRLAVSGYSYGGFMTGWLTSRDERFAAAVAGGMVADVTSLVGTSDLGHFMSEYELAGPAWESKDAFATASPLTHVDRVRTPTLVLHGGEDRRCPVGQAEQWHTALRELHVPTRLVVYPGGSHLFILEGRLSHRVDYQTRLVDWVEQHAGTGRAPLDRAHWSRRLQSLATRHHVPGATLGILRLHDDRDDEVVTAAHGAVNLRTGVETTLDSVFQIGSISKVWTATVAMQLVDEGLIDLDAPVIEVLPGLRLSDPDVTQQVTLRHLLTHTSGIDGDDFTDTGRGDDCVEKYVDRMDQIAQNHPLGATWSYCNSGFVLIGRIIEQLTGGTWDQAIRDRIVTPLGLTHTVTLPEEALLHRTAVGHVGDGDGGATVAPEWMLPRSVGPAGLISSTVDDVLEFARFHLAGGTTREGTQLLSADSTRAMAEHQADVPDKRTLGDSWGLGWIRFGWDGRRLIGHDGNTIGQSAFLRILPEEGLAVVLLTNGGNAGDLFQDLYREIFADLADLAIPAPLAPPADLPPVDLQRHVGTYERAGARITVEVRDERLGLTVMPTGPLAELGESDVELALQPLDATGDLFMTRAPGTQTAFPVTFYSLATGEAYVHLGARATPRTS
jgi:dipeptidyl aminopeptidase/acylaminoacyl peptidase/CubicO group peptidase (beta-lactamase class C family)